MAKVMLLANAEPGVEISKFINSIAEDEIVALYVSGNYPDIDNRIFNSSGLPRQRLFSVKDLDDAEHLKWLKSQNVDVLITVYWPFLLEREVFSLADKTVNFHPAMLPVNRGWYPHVHSLIDGSISGVTLHVIEKEADSGPIWAQNEVKIKHTDTAKTLYLRLQEEIVILFKENWQKIKHDLIKPVNQIEDRATYHSKHELEALDAIDLNKKQTAKEVINLLRSRSFGDLGFSYYEECGERVYVNIRLSSDVDMNKEGNK